VEARVSIGETLAVARQRAGLSVAQVSERTRIRETIIRGIEDDDYSACGGDFYARGHIRAIAKVVGTDSEPLIREYDTLRRAPGAAAAVSLEELVATSAQAPSGAGRICPRCGE
jgi:cytoskeletal protein RodZ